MMMTKERAILKAKQTFDALLALVETAGDEEWRIDEVERGVFGELLELGLRLVQAFVAQAGDGDEGAKVEHGGKQLQRLPKSRRRYLSVFGELFIERYVYAARRRCKTEYRPLDAHLGLPESDISYVLQDWLGRLCIKEAFAEAAQSLYTLLGLKIGVHTAERQNQKLAEYAGGFRESQAPPAWEDEEEILVVAADGKGVPMRREPEEEEEVEQPSGHQRRGKGEKANPKRMAYAGAVYSIARFRRTSDEVMDEVAQRQSAQDRPRPCHKRLWAELNDPPDSPEPGSGRQRLFARLAMEVFHRRPGRKKPLVCLMDGERKLWEMKKEWLRRAVGILDFYHVSERVWTTAHVFHAEGSQEAQTFANKRLRMLLDGKVGYMIRDLRRLLRTKKLSKAKRTTLQAQINYFQNNQQHMRYDEYLAAGYPIGSGVIEGACRHLVKDRLEQTGMKWRPRGAQAMLHTRAVHLNGDWDDFIRYRIATEQENLYTKAAA